MHIIHEFVADFYDSELRAIVCEYIRPERNYASLDALIAAIKADIDLARTRTNDVDAYRRLKVRRLARASCFSFFSFSPDQPDRFDAPSGRFVLCRRYGHRGPVAVERESCGSDEDQG